MRELRPYQQEAINRYHDSPGAAFIMKMRLGKTLTCIRWLDQHPFCPKKNLIVAPKTVLISWEIELAKEGKEFYNLLGMKVVDRREHLLNPPDCYLLINYETLSLLKGKKRKYDGVLNNFDAVILDESTRIKSIKAKATQLLLAAACHIPVRAILSGEPAPENWQNVWTQLAFANGGSWMKKSNFYEWQKYYFIQYGFDYVLRPQEEALIKKAFHDDCYILTRKQAGIRDEKIRQVRSGDLEPKTRDLYDRVVATWELPATERVIYEPNLQAKYAMVVCSWLRRICGGILPTKPLQFIGSWKYAELLSILVDEIPNESVVVWFAFNAELAAVYSLLQKRGISSTWITGECDFAERATRIKDFSVGTRRVLLIQEQVGQFGIDLSRSDIAIYFSSHYSYEYRTQSEERIFSVGKPNDNLIIDLITNDSIDVTIQESLAGKKTDASLLLARFKPPTGFRQAHNG